MRVCSSCIFSYPSSRSYTSSLTTVVIYTAAAAVTATIYSLLLPLLTAGDVTLSREPTIGAKVEMLFEDLERRG